jgi:hypothetical protein
MAFLIIGGFRVYCAEKSGSLQHFIDLKIPVQNPDNAEPTRKIPRPYTDK